MGAVLGAAALAGCSAQGAPAGPTTGAAPTASPSSEPGAAQDSVPGSGALPGTHVHAAAFDPDDASLLLATHDGLFRYASPGAPPERVGPAVDLMGLTVAGPGRLYASGHPGPGSELPAPLGLVESTDSGASWSPRSLGGSSDFHTLAAARGTVLGFDGQLRSSEDGQRWATLRPPAAPFALAASPDAPLVLATSESGLLRSVDSGATWERVDGAPLLQVAAVLDAERAVALTPGGQVAVSDDGGLSWDLRAELGQPPQAVTARQGPSGAVEVVVATTSQLLSSTDGAATFTTGWLAPA